MLAVQILIGLMIVLGVGIIVFSRNIIHAAYALSLALLGIAGVYVLLNAELLAVVQILIYAGGVVILLAFGVMMTHRLRGEKVLSGAKNQFPAAITAIAIFVILAHSISETNFPGNKVPKMNNQVEHIGVAFLTEHIVAFELIAFILLVALVGAAYLAKLAANE
ncbi:MAG: NADH-quinone oxidoreductase subunit J [Bacteroidota bacterium]